MTRYLHMESPIGTLLLTGDSTALTGMYMQHGPSPVESDWIAADDDLLLCSARNQLELYFSGGLTRFDLPLALYGTEFQTRVWSALCDIPFGETISYGELARRTGNPAASRAVGLANGRNPVSIIVPCHRVIGANGKLTGYGGGLERKAWLLEHERTGKVA